MGYVSVRVLLQNDSTFRVASLVVVHDSSMVGKGILSSLFDSFVKKRLINEGIQDSKAGGALAWSRGVMCRYSRQRATVANGRRFHSISVGRKRNFFL
ncbi:hypothetical protein SLE2022_245120 [Rubroshorea leprosula]